MKVVARFYWDCGRMGSVDGLFVTTKETLDKAYGKQVYLGEVLGKHSEICGKLKDKDIDILTDDQEFIEKLEKIVGSSDISGYNPLNYMDDENLDLDLDEEE